MFSIWTTLKFTRYNSADSVPTSNLVCTKEVAPRTTFYIADIIWYTFNLVNEIQYTRYKMPSKNVLNKLCNKNKIYSEKKYITVCNAVYFRLCIDLMHILPPVTTEGFDGSHHLRGAECSKIVSLGKGCVHG